MNNFVKDFDALSEVSREKYIDTYHKLGELMFEECDVPTVGDFVDIIKKTSNYEKSKNKLTQITSFTGNTSDIEKSLAKTSSLYSAEESQEFMKKVIASNIDDISNSGFFYKKLMASTDNMRISTKIKDCGSEGEPYLVEDITKDIYEYKIKTHFIQELDKYIEDYDEFVELCKSRNLTTVHVRTFLTCTVSKNHKTFCPKCAGLFRRNDQHTFIPKYIGLYSTLMITEHATQASLDSMNKGRSKSVNAIIEEKFENDKFESYDKVKETIEEIIDDIGNVGVLSKYYEIALLSRFYKGANDTYTVSPLISSIMKQKDELGTFIYRPTIDNFHKLLSKDEISASSLKSRIMFDIYE